MIALHLLPLFIIASEDPKLPNPIVWKASIGSNPSEPHVFGNIIVLSCSTRSRTTPGDNYDRIYFINRDTGNTIHSMTIDNTDEPINCLCPIIYNFCSVGDYIYFIDSHMKLRSVNIKSMTFESKVIVDLYKDFRCVHRYKDEYIDIGHKLTVHGTDLVINTGQTQFATNSNTQRMSPSVILYDTKLGKIKWSYENHNALEKSCPLSSPLVFRYDKSEYVLSALSNLKYCCLQYETGKLISVIDLEKGLHLDDKLLYDTWTAPMQIDNNIVFFLSTNYDSAIQQAPIISIGLQDIITTNAGSVLDSIMRKKFIINQCRPLLHNSKIYLSGKDGRVGVLDANTMTMNIFTGKDISNQFCSPLIYGDKLLIIGDDDLFLYNIDSDKQYTKLHTITIDPGRRKYYCEINSGKCFLTATDRLYMLDLVGH